MHPLIWSDAGVFAVTPGHTLVDVALEITELEVIVLLVLPQRSGRLTLRWR